MANEVTEKQIEQWKVEHQAVYELPVGDKKGYLRQPKMTDYKIGFKAMLNGGDIAFSEAMLRALWLGGDKDILDEDAYFIPAKNQIKDFLDYEDAEISALKNGQSEITIDGYKCIVRFITRDDLKRAESENPSNKTFVTQEKLFDKICVFKDEVFTDKNNASIRFPLYKAIESLQNKKYALLKKL
ncbi:hypothetical protein PG913_08255 [Tenacibaculum pacificus]|uniref:hypothetical protein n=1 Tax=Tenacibaculum TaxID=104267 RepID=UPI0022F3F181|nr:hypothetical protein [Tenacibaculum pacificus]WBX72895.1 hypothetical protein PG913_08255 [Tenacibaculum pacificus]